MHFWIFYACFAQLVFQTTVLGTSPIDCNFESAYLCVYQQFTGDQLDWTRYRGSRSIYGTGPLVDHTYGRNNQGYYMVIQSSAALNGYTAILVTPSLSAAAASSCVRFWYNMNGYSMGTLSVATALANDLSHRTVVWNRTGNQGADWLEAVVSVDTFRPIQILFQGTMNPLGDVSHSDMAIDDVSAAPGSCDGHATGSSVDCNFEAGNLCGYQQLSATGSVHDDMDWILTGGPIYSVGPANDHTLNNTNGHYIFINSTSLYSRATLVSPATSSGSARSCLTFWYSMYGSTAGGQLHVLTATPHLQHLTTVWSRFGHQGPGWTMANVTLDTAHPVEVVFSGLYTDLALDDIRLTSGSCEEGSTATTHIPLAATTAPTLTMSATGLLSTTPGTRTDLHTTTATISPGTCQQCEGLQCFTGPVTVNCSSLHPLCFARVRDFANGERTVVKGCVSLSDCNSWTPSESELQHCLSVDKQVTGHNLDCLFCCHGDLCNKGPNYIPKTDTWVGQNQHRILIG